MTVHATFKKDIYILHILFKTIETTNKKIITEMVLWQKNTKC